MNARKSLPDACFPTGFVPNVARIKAMDGTRRITETEFEKQERIDKKFSNLEIYESHSLQIQHDQSSNT